MTTDFVQPQIVIAKDTTLRISLGVLVLLIGYAGFGTWQFLELRQAERDRVNGMIASASANISQLSATTNQQFSAISSDLNYTSRTLDGYKSRTDRLDEGLQEIKILRHRIDQIDQAHSSYDRRLQLFESKFEELNRKTAEHAIVIDYLIRWINPTPAPSDPPKKRNETSPFKFGENYITSVSK